MSGWAAMLFVVVAGAGVWTALDFVRRPAGADTATDRPIEVADNGYASSGACRSCHPSNYDTWHSSYHRRMTAVATPENMIGDFDDATAVANGRKYSLQRQGDEFWVTMKDPDVRGPVDHLPWIRRRIVLVTGSHHMQVYWYATGDGRKLGQLPVVYLNEDQKWVPRTAIFLQPEVGHISSETGRWNRTCIKCHTTNGQPRLDEHSTEESFDTHVAQFGISCEECHSPAEQHVGLNGNPLRRYRSHFTKAQDESAVQPRNLEAARSSQVCGQCHGILLDPDDETQREYFVGHGFEFVPGANLGDSRVVVQPNRIDALPALQRMVEEDPTFVDRSFWSDGMVRVSGREYNGLIESPCFAGGEFSCLSCHAMHQDPDDARPRTEWANDQLKPGMDGDQACVQCHDDFTDVPAHTHHAAESAGSSCYNCHMPYTTYGLLKAIRSHQVNSPTVTASLATGRPNACNQCHLDKTLAWTSRYLSEWYGIAPPELESEAESIAASVRWLLEGEAGQRALMAWSMCWEDAVQASGDDWLAPYLAVLLADPYATVRYIAHRSLRGLEGFQNFEYDYVGSPEHREEAAARAMAQWTKAHAARGRPARDAVLIGTQGLQSDVFERMLRNRDERVVILAE